MRLFSSKCEPVLETYDIDTLTLKIDYTVLDLVFCTKQHIYNIVKVQIFWFSFTIFR